MENLLTIKEVVEEVLNECPPARDSDKLLTILVYKKLGFRMYIDDIKNSPSFESIRRSRQKIQEDKKKCQPSEQVEIFRKNKQKEYRRFSNEM